jgi:hypothetical protein
MKESKTLILAVMGALLLLIALMATAAWAAPHGRDPGAAAPAGHDLTAPLVSLGVVSDAISYQGRLLDSSGDPVDGTRAIEFRLYTEPGGGMPLWSQSQTVPVEDGLFNVHLTVNPAQFDGRALWLGVQVQGDAHEMAPRQPLLPVPYALSLRPGAGISGTVPGIPTLNIASDGIGLAAQTTGGADPRDPAVLGENLGPGTGPGLEGFSENGSAVLGRSLNGPGVLGLSEHVVGVHGESVDGHGGFFTSTNAIGIEAHTLSTDERDPAVLGMNHGPDRGSGVEGHSENGSGVLGRSLNGPGVFGLSEDVVGVHGESVEGHGGFFTSTNAIGIEAHTGSPDQSDSAILGINEGMGHGVEGRGVWGYGVRGFSINVPGIGGESIYGSGGVFSTTHGEGIVVAAAGQHGLRIYDTVGGDYIRTGGILAPDFRVTPGGDVFADGAYNCGLGPGAEPGTCVVQNSPADFAEMLPAHEGLEPGDVLVIGPDGRLARSTEAYQPSVIGIHSTQPGYLGGGQHRGNPGYAPVALVGVVPVKASAENGAITPGDLLVASATPGHAMRAGSNPAVGTVIGKALEGLNGGIGTILMLVMLQ